MSVLILAIEPKLRNVLAFKDKSLPQYKLPQIVIFKALSLPTLRSKDIKPY